MSTKESYQLEYLCGCGTNIRLEMISTAVFAPDGYQHCGKDVGHVLPPLFAVWEQEGDNWIRKSL